MSSSERYSQTWRKKIREMQQQAKEREQTIHTQACRINALEDQVTLYREAALGK